MEFQGTNDDGGNNGNNGEDRPKIMRQGYPVPAELIGFIIGKGGANIDQIQRASSAKLSTKDDNGPPSFQRDWVYIQIEGTGREVSGSWRNGGGTGAERGRPGSSGVVRCCSVLFGVARCRSVSFVVVCCRLLSYGRTGSYGVVRGRTGSYDVCRSAAGVCWSAGLHLCRCIGASVYRCAS